MLPMLGGTSALPIDRTFWIEYDDCLASMANSLTRLQAEPNCRLIVRCDEAYLRVNNNTIVHAGTEFTYVLILLT